MLAFWSPTRDVLVGIARSALFQSEPVAARALEVLAPGERAAAARVRSPVARAEFVAGRWLARTLLARQAGCDAAAIRLRLSHFGRPEVVAPRPARGLRFSIAHSDGIALCAVSDGPAVGADVESLRSLGRDPLAIAEVVCSESEREDLLATPPAARAERVLTAWTFKEALAKASGLGMNLPLTSIAVQSPAGETASVRWGPEDGEGRCTWRLIALRPTAEHFAAVAVRIERPGPAAALGALGAA